MALIYFHAYMYGPIRGKVRLYKERGLRPRMAMSEDWEIFASILLRNSGAEGGKGPDLESYEVKSALDGSSFEYQYHKNSWRDKLDADRAAGHIFISHKDELECVDVRYSDGAEMVGFFDAWKAAQPYSRESQQRFRRNVPFGWVTANARLILRIEHGEATYGVEDH